MIGGAFFVLASCRLAMKKGRRSAPLKSDQSLGYGDLVRPVQRLGLRGRDAPVS